MGLHETNPGATAAVSVLLAQQDVFPRPGPANLIRVGMDTPHASGRSWAGCLVPCIASGRLSDPSSLRSLLGCLTRWPSAKDLTVRVENLGLVSAPPKEKPIKPCPVDARSLNLSHKHSLTRFGGDSQFRWTFSEIFLTSWGIARSPGAKRLTDAPALHERR